MADSSFVSKHDAFLPGVNRLRKRCYWHQVSVCSNKVPECMCSHSQFVLNGAGNLKQFSLFKDNKTAFFSTLIV